MEDQILSYEDINLTLTGPVATVTVNRPDKLNALRNQTAEELKAAIKSLEENAETKVVILTGSGKAFGTGYDLSTIDLDTGCNLAAILDNHFNPLIQAIYRSRLLFISMVNGPCAGVSVAIALSCDIVMAARSAYFYEPFAQIALVPDGGNTFFLPKAAGRSRAMAAMLLGEKITADEAMEWGLVWQVHDAEALLGQVNNVAARIGLLASMAIQRTKQLVNTACDNGLDAQLERERDVQGELDGSPEMIAAISRFLKNDKSRQ